MNTPYANWLKISAVCGALVSPMASAQLFEDNFESYDVGSIVGWDESAGSTIVDETTVATFGSPNQAMHFNGLSQKLMKNVAANAVGGVTTLSFDFVESAEDLPTSGLVFGYGVANEINTDNAAIRLELRNGSILHNTIGGLSVKKQSGTTTFLRGEAYRLFIVCNDTDAALTDYNGEEDLAARSFEVWLYSEDSGLQQVVEATIGRNPEYAGFRTWASFNDSLFIDNVRIDAGVDLSGASPAGCSLMALRNGILSGTPFLLEYTVEVELPAGSSYTVTSSGDASFTGGASGPAALSGQIEATVNAANREQVTFRIEIQDDAGGVVCTGSTRVMVFNYTTPSSMVHPSIISTTEQLDLMRKLVLSYPGSMALAGWNAMRATPYASKSYVHTPQETVLVVPSGGNESEAAFRNDCAAARSHALQWVVTGDPVHRDIALTILNDWGHTYRDIQSTGSADQVQLESAWALPVWLSAADILRYYKNGAAGWNPQDMAAFNSFMEALYQKSLGTLHRDQNWGASASLAVMAYGAWIGDEAIFLTGLNNQIVKLDNISQPDGQIIEICRDTWHPQYTVVSWTDSAELAHNQGYDDLYEITFDGQETPRLVIVLEYFANLMRGNTPAPCDAGWGYNYLGEYDRFDNYEVPYNHYLNREARTDMPVFQQMVEKYWRKNVGADAHFLLWSRLTQGTVVLDQAGNTIPWGKGILSGYPARTDRWVNTDPWLGWLNDTSYPWLYAPDIGYFYVVDGDPGAGFWAYVPR